MIEEATVDCYNDSECETGFYTMLDQHLDTPFQTSVLGTPVTVTGVDLSADAQLAVICVRDGTWQILPLLELWLPVPPPAGAEWIDAYRRWHG